MANRDALVSVVIPSYNYGRFVTEAVASALAQTYRDVEVIVVDDGSTDDTRQRLAPYGDRIRYIHQENRGLSAARNTGIRAARGAFVALLDADDLWHPRKLEVQVRHLQEHPEVALVASDHLTQLDGGWPAVGEREQRRARAVSLEDLVIKSRFGPSGVLARRACFGEVGLFDTGLRSAEDRDMWIRIAARFPVVTLEAPLWFYRLHGGSMSRVGAVMEDSEHRVLRKAFDEIDALRRRRLLRRKGLSRAAYVAAYRYNVGRRPGLALGRMLRSLWLWPLPYRRSEVRMALARPKLLGAILLQVLRPGHDRLRLQAS